MTTLEAVDGTSGYLQLVEHVVRHGRRRDARGMKTYDAGTVTLRLEHIDHSLPLGVGRNLNRMIGAAEALQLIGGFSEPALLFAASGNFRRYVEDDGRFWGAYGERIGDQLAAVLGKIESDRDTRQAVVTLWNPALDNVLGRRDYPCTVALNFTLTPDDRLEMRTLMRSQDVWLGTPYDVMQFTQLQWTVARLLGAGLYRSQSSIVPGAYEHTTWSTHIYEQHMEATQKLHDPPPLADREWQPCGVSGWTLFDVRRNALGIVHTGLTSIDTPTPSDVWYTDVLGDWRAKLTAREVS